MNLTKQDIDFLMETVQMVIVGIMNADGVQDGFKMLNEAKTIGDFFTTASDDYKDSGLVRLIIDLLDAQRRHPSIRHIKIVPSKLKIQRVMEYVAKADKILVDHPEAMAFRNFLYQLAMTVANAYGPSESKITEREREFIDLLKSKSKFKDNKFGA